VAGPSVPPAGQLETTAIIPHQSRSLVREDAMAAKFVLQQGSTGKYHFNLVAINGQVIASSESYKSKSSALSGIESVKRNAATAQVEDQTKRCVSGRLYT
jgi:uncharacterized protein